jgi:hypothetical protein
MSLLPTDDNEKGETMTPQLENTRLLTHMLTWIFIIIFIIFALFVASTIPPAQDRSKIPEGCGETASNYSESYTIHNMCGLAPCPLKLYYTDLVCSNGTSILKWRTTSTI